MKNSLFLSISVCLISILLAGFGVVMVEKNIFGGNFLNFVGVALSLVSVYLFYQLFQHQNLQQGISLLFSHFGMSTLGVGLFAFKINENIGLLLLSMSAFCALFGIFKVLAYIFYPKNV
jgi:hypothetical protein